MKRNNHQWSPSAGVLAVIVVAASGCSSSESAPAASSSTAGGDPPASRPNVLFLIADDVGVDATLPYADTDGDGGADDGRSYAPMPNLQEVCREGVLFRNAWSSPVCSPTRATLLTGRHGFRTGIGTVVTRTNAISPDEVTLPRMLDEASSGYRHALIGKWHLGTTTALDGKKAPNTMGWSHHAGSLSGEVDDYYAWTKTVDGVDVSVTTYATTETVDDAIAWIERGDASQPWVVSLAFNAPHIPYHLPPKELHAYDTLSGTEADIAQKSVSYFEAALEAMDTEVGRLLTWLEENGHENTNIIFLGDNGTAQRVVQAPYVGTRAKGTLYEGGVHVPLCISGPAVVNGGREVDSLVHTVDLFATALDLAGVDRAAALPDDVTFDSVSLAPYLDESASESLRASVLSEVFGGQEPSGKAIRDARYKLIRFDAGTDELYDLERDPLETDDLLSAGMLSAEAAEHRASLEKSLSDLLATAPSGR